MKSNNEIFNKDIDLSDNKIHVFLLQLDLYDYDEFIAYLPNDERKRANKVKIEEKRKQFVITRGAVRKLLANILQMSADQIPFKYGQHKKPYIDHQYNNSSIEFNVSHSDNHALIGLTLGSKIGVDIEKINYEIDYQALSKRFFSEKENEALYLINPDQQTDAFYDIWARKESFIKATGKGVAFGLDRFSVLASGQAYSRVEIENPDSTDEEWYCYNLMDVDKYKLALTSSDKDKGIIFYQ